MTQTTESPEYPERFKVEIAALGDGCLSLIKHIFVGIPHTTSGKENMEAG